MIFNLRKVRKNVKAISPVISVLLMIAVAVVASLVAYAWVMGYMNFQTAKTGQAVQIQSVAFAADETPGTGMNVTAIYVQNIGDGTVSFAPNQCLYVNGALVTDTTSAVAPSPATLTKGATGTIDVAAITGLNFASGETVVFKVVVEGGTYSEVSQIVP
jgi:flagellin-like protein